MRRIGMVTGLALGVAWGGCDALEPEWSEPVAALPSDDCASICATQGNLCLENSCEGGTVATFGEEGNEAECDAAFGDMFGHELAWNVPVVCCCGSH